jgi:hypothetical protein
VFDLVRQAKEARDAKRTSEVTKEPAEVDRHR